MLLNFRLSNARIFISYRELPPLLEVCFVFGVYLLPAEDGLYEACSIYEIVKRKMKTAFIQC